MDIKKLDLEKLLVSFETDPRTGFKVGEEIFVAGSRFHIIGTLAQVRYDLKTATTSYRFDGVIQIDYDSERKVDSGYFLGDGMWLYDHSIAWVMQRLVDRPDGYAESYREMLKKHT